MRPRCWSQVRFTTTFVFNRCLRSAGIGANLSVCEWHPCPQLNMARSLQQACSGFKCGQHLVVRGFHTVLTLAILASLLYKDTALHNAIVEAEDLTYGLSFLVLVTATLILYYTACCVDPGYVPIVHQKCVQVKPKKVESEAEDNSDDPEACEVDLMLPAAEENQAEHEEKLMHVKLRRCGFCGIEQPLRTRHCEDCGRCVRKFDHHCPWLETCIGERNHRWFWAFLLTKSALIVWAFFIVWDSYSPNKDWGPWFHSNGIYLVDTVILLIAGFVAIALTCMHTYTMVLNMTTWEIVSKERITYLRDLEIEINPFHEGYCRNTYNFLCRCRLRNWNRLYSRNVTIHGAISTV